MENNGSVTIAVNDFIHSLYAYKNISLYDANHVFDEEKSVRWNREEVERLNNSYDNRLSEAYTQARSEAAALRKCGKNSPSFMWGMNCHFTVCY